MTRPRRPQSCDATRGALRAPDRTNKNQSDDEARAMNVAFKDPQTNRSLDALAEALLLPSGIEGVYAAHSDF